MKNYTYTIERTRSKDWGNRFIQVVYKNGEVVGETTKYGRKWMVFAIDFKWGDAPVIDVEGKTMGQLLENLNNQ